MLDSEGVCTIKGSDPSVVEARFNFQTNGFIIYYEESIVDIKSCKPKVPFGFRRDQIDFGYESFQQESTQTDKDELIS